MYGTHAAILTRNGQSATCKVGPRRSATLPKMGFRYVNLDFHQVTKQFPHVRDGAS